MLAVQHQGENRAAVKMVPRPTSVATSMRPPWLSTMPLQM
jgi:hypothetical protein